MQLGSGAQLSYGWRSQRRDRRRRNGKELQVAKGDRRNSLRMRRRKAQAEKKARAGRPKPVEQPRAKPTIKPVEPEAEPEAESSASAQE